MKCADLATQQNLKSTVIVIGAAGFIGSHLAEKLLRENYRVIGIDSFIHGYQANIEFLSQLGNDDFIFIEHSIERSWDGVLQMMKQFNILKIEFVFHFASLAEPSKFQSHFQSIMKTNSIGTINAIEFADSFGARLVYASTSEIYGCRKADSLSEKDIGEVDTTGARSSYNESKRFSESYITNSNFCNQTRHGIVRIFNTYGPRMHLDDTRVITSILRAINSDQEITIFGNGLQTRSFCFVTDLVDGIISYALSNITEPMNLGSDNEISINTLTNKILLLTRSTHKIKHLKQNKDEPQKRKPNLEFAQQAIHFTNRISLEAGLLLTIDSLNKNLKIISDSQGNALINQSEKNQADYSL